jgi:general stress protein 26
MLQINILNGVTDRRFTLKNNSEIKEMLRDLFSRQYFMVLATGSDEKLHTSLVAFASTDDLNWFYFAAPRNTRKFQNLSKNARVSLFIDNRTNDPTDITNKIGVTVEGTAAEIEVKGREQTKSFFLAKNSYLKEFVNAPNTALIAVKVLRYRIVSHFQDVVILNVDEHLGGDEESD